MEVKTFGKVFGCLLGLAVASSVFSESEPSISNKNSLENNVPVSSSLTRAFPLRREDITVQIQEIIDLYTDCDQKVYEGKKPTFKKNYKKVVDGVRRRRNLEDLWTRYFNEQIDMSYLGLHSVDITSSFKFPLGRRASFDNSFDYARIREGRWVERHNAIDIFADTGSYISSPISGLVIASADDWKGSLNRRTGFQYEEGTGLGKLSGNGVLLFSPIDTGYYFMIHMSKVYKKSGDVVSRGEPVGTVGKTGNATYPNVQKHLHIAYKKPGMGCGIKGVLVSQNPYYNLRKAQIR